MRSKKILKNQRGQMAIFLVLVFQILFVFFAMSMNIGLVVYDKINLQNATDLAAYYAAQKQAEMFNEIAHINFQIRQAYKLLTFRQRVIGSVSIGVGPFSTLQKHPIFGSGASQGSEGQEFFEQLGGRHTPGTCIGSTLWHEYKITEGSDTVSLCQNLDGFSAPPPAGGSDPFGFISGLNGFLSAVAAELEQKCKVVGVLNWQLTASWLLGFILESQKRTQMIDSLAQRLSQPGQEMTDFTGNSIALGARRTLEKNLTTPQRSTLSMQIVNSLSPDVQGPCNDPRFWLPKVDIYPAVTYVRMIWSGLRCTTSIVTNRSAANLPPADYMGMVGGRDNGLLSSVWSSNSPITYGVEKNPWCMAYMGVKASTFPRKIFSPFSSGIALKAESFAKPFGGRIGPWYGKSWPSGAATSIDTGGRTDPLLPSRSTGGGGAADPAKDMVNYSKYPGDKYGMNSAFGLGNMSAFFTNESGSDFASLKPVLALAHYNHIGDGSVFQSAPDSLARSNGGGGNGAMVRTMENAAIAPDLFDITYYSVEGQFSFNFFNPNVQQFMTQMPEYYVDLGSQSRNPWSVVSQIRDMRSLYGGNVPFYLVDDPTHLLTGWTQNKAVNYEFPEDFGVCHQRRDDEMASTPGPGGCPHGGRSGYSVKIVSKNYLNTANPQLGGVGGGTGPILNKPAD